jgi:anti-anti-sigma regulatory factor
MASKDVNAGLLSKVAKFVRNPTTNWSDLDAKEPPPEPGYDKEALKEMIERKRQNDYIRRREFDQLRKLRNRGPTAAVDAAGRPSFYQSSMPSNIGERADTIKKIDEIEAQMSKQWWKSKHAGTDGASTPLSAEAAAAADAPTAAVPVGSATQSAASAPTQPPTDEALPTLREHLTDFALTQPAAATAEAPTQLAATLHQAFEPTPVSPGMGLSGLMDSRMPQNGSGFSTSKLFSEESSDDMTDPDLEEAAIRFANGDDAGAEAGLLDVLARFGDDTSRTGVWIAALFDFYRATGQQDRFEAVALEFAEKFGRSAPAWFSMPGQLGLKPAASVSAAANPPPSEVAIWTCPAHLDAMAMNDLHLALANAPLPWCLDWHQLESLDADALKPLAQLFASWCTLRVKLRYIGAQRLEKALARRTPSGDKSVAVDWWQLRMDALRIMRLQDAFELVALDYCVTFEVSPPAWQDARCGYVCDDQRSGDEWEAGFAFTHPRDTQADPVNAADQAYTVPMGLEDVPAVVVELVGDILGDAVDSIQQLEASRQQGAARLVVSCAKLIRVDFSAAGSLLNWVANRQNEGCNVQFRDVHRLVGAFFNVIGINEHARVVLRAH